MEGQTSPQASSDPMSNLTLDLAEAMDLETLDESVDNEFGIPRPAEDMRLSEILNEEDPPDLDDDTGLQGKLSELLIAADSQSMSSYDSLSATAKQHHQQQQQQQHRRKQQRARDGGAAASGIVLHYGTLKSVSNQLLSAKQRADAGLPTCITVGSYIAVGTAHGSVFLFDTKQALQWCLDAATSPDTQQHQHHQVGGVSALDFSYDMRKLLVGYTRGQLSLWDTATGRRLMHIADAHPPGSAVLHARFTLSPKVAVFSDSAGSVYQLSFGRQLTRRTADSACLFSGSRGEICTLAPLSLPPKLLDHPLVATRLLAMASFTKVFLVRMSPELAVVMVEPLAGRPCTLPQICWQVGCCGGGSAASQQHPCLVYGRDDVIRVARVSNDSSPSGVRVTHLKQLTLSRLGVGPLLSLHFLGHAGTAAVADQRERLCVLDLDAEVVLESESLNPVQLVYNTAAFKALATGSNVSAALAYAADTACYHSVRAFEGQLVVIGAQTLHIYRLRTWEERLLVLKQRRLWPELFRLAGDLCSGGRAGGGASSTPSSSSVAVVGLSHKPERRRAAVQPRVRALLEEYLADQLALPSLLHQQPQPPLQLPEPAPEDALRAAELTLTACHRTDQLDWLFADLLPRSFFLAAAAADQPPASSSASTRRRAFLESLRPFLVNSGVRLAPAGLVSSLLSHLVQSEAPPDSIEELLLHLDVACLDADAALQLSWQHGLYDAVVYVHTVAMGDPVTPLKQLLEELKRRQADALTNQFDASFQRLGGKAMVHLSACLAGQPYFVGDASPSTSMAATAANAQLNVFALLVNKCARTSRFDNLEALCRFSVGDLLNFLALAFQEAFFAGEAGLARKQELLDDLIATVADGRGFSPAQVGSLFSFLVKLLMQPHSAGLQFPARVFDQVLEYLCTPPAAARQPQDAASVAADTSEQQAAVIALLNSGRLSANVNSDRLLALAKEARFHLVCSHLYLERRDFAPVVECMLLDGQRAPAVFDFVAEVLHGSQQPQQPQQQQQLSDKKRRAVRETCWRLLDKLVSTDAHKSVLLITRSLDETVSAAVRQLAGQPELCYQLLGAYFGLLRQQDQEAAAAAAAASAPMIVGPAAVSLALPRDDEAFLTEAYLKLMADYAPARLVDALQSGLLCFNPKSLIKHLHSRQQSEAQALCYELSGQTERALDVLLARLDSAWDSGDASAAMDWLGRCADTCARAVRPSSSAASAPPASSAADSGNASAVAAEQLWFRLLDRVLQRARGDGHSTPQLVASSSPKDSVDGADASDLVRAACRALVARMTAGSGVSLPSVLRRLLSDPAYTADRVGELRDLLVHLLDSCRYEGTLMATCAGLVGRDANSRLLEACRSARRAAAATAAASCIICGLQLDEIGSVSTGGSQDILLFKRCGHACHAHCCRRGPTERGGGGPTETGRGGPTETGRGGPTKTSGSRSSEYGGGCPACGSASGGGARIGVGRRSSPLAAAAPSTSAASSRLTPQTDDADQLQRQRQEASAAAEAAGRYFRLLRQLRTPDRTEFFDSLALSEAAAAAQQRAGGGGANRPGSRQFSAVPLRLSPATPAWL